MRLFVIVIALAAIIAAYSAGYTSGNDAPWIWKESATESRVIYHGQEIIRITSKSPQKIDYCYMSTSTRCY